MPKYTDFQEIERLVASDVLQFGVTTTRQIIDRISGTLGYSPSTATIAKVLKELGYKAQREYWQVNE